MASVVASCNFLDKEPYEIVPENYFQNENEASSVLTGIYAILGQSTFMEETIIYWLVVMT